MLPNRTVANKLVTITYIDKDNCDINADDDDNHEDTNNNDLLHGVCDTKNSSSFVPNVNGQSVANNLPTKMTVQQESETLLVRRPSPINLKPIANDHLDEDTTDGCFGDSEDSEHECTTGINVNFQDIIYRARPGFLWDRCKCEQRVDLCGHSVWFRFVFFFCH